MTSLSDTARRSTKGMRPGVGARKSTKSQPAPHMERNSQGSAFTHLPSKDDSRDSGSDEYYARLRKWVAGGKRP